MSTTETSVRPARVNTAIVILAGLVAILGMAYLYHVLNRPPQMGANEEVFRTVDALFTAITARDEKRLGECEQRLHGYRDAGQLPLDAADSLDAIIRKARSGAWGSAAERLYVFIRAQRREGIEPSTHIKTKPGSKR